MELFILVGIPALLFFSILYFVIKSAVKNGINEAKEIKKLNIELQDIKKRVKVLCKSER